MLSRKNVMERSLGPFILLLTLFFVVWAGVLFFQYRKTRDEARLVFDAAVRRNEISATEDFPTYERAFLKTSDLRVGLYRVLALLAAVISIPISITIVGFIWAKFYYLFDRPAWMTEGELVHSFTLAVSAMLGLVGVAAIFARRYHQYRPGPFNEEWEKEKAMPDAQTGPSPMETN